MCVLMKALRQTILISVWLCLALSVACSKEPVPGGAEMGISVKSAVMPSLAPGQMTAAIYLLLENNTEQTLVINHIVSSISDHIEVHRTFYEDGMMKMRSAPHVSIAPSGKMRFAPEGYHLMVFDISSPVQAGDQFSLTIEFEGGKTVTGKVDVRRLAL